MLILSSCVVLTRWPKPIFIGGFPEKNYDFMESIEHYSTDSYFNTIQQLKWGGTIYGLDSEIKMFKWLRNPENLTKAFNTFELLGLENFLSKEQYYNKKLFNSDYWSYDWNNKSLNDICKVLIVSYTDSTEIDKYYIDFWNRRRLEGNDFATYNILKRIDNIYASKFIESTKPSNDYDTIMYRLLDYDIRMQKSDTLTRTKVIVNYFEYLKQIGLEHSAYNLICKVSLFRNLKLNLDSLVYTLKYDTISKEKYYRLSNNAKWI